jgi:hypothetical protein
MMPQQNPLGATYSRMGSVRICESAHCADRHLDTSACRSPARALRRWRKRGIKGRIALIVTPWRHAYQLPDGTLVMHPTVAKALREKTLAKLGA